MLGYDLARYRPETISSIWSKTRITLVGRQCSYPLIPIVP